jgi:hypothetical protein
MCEERKKNMRGKRESLKKEGEIGEKKQNMTKDKKNRGGRENMKKGWR